jgi:uncharacterized protein (TIGR03067 family)
MGARLVPRLVLLSAWATVAGPAMAQEGDVSGSWVAVQAEREGEAAQDLVGHELVFEGNRFVIGQAGQALYAGTYALDPVSDPPSIDFQHEAGQLVGTTWEGIYELNVNRLVICDDAVDPDTGRPGDFSTSSGSLRSRPPVPAWPSAWASPMVR